MREEEGGREGGRGREGEKGKPLDRVNLPVFPVGSISNRVLHE